MRFGESPAVEMGVKGLFKKGAADLCVLRPFYSLQFYLHERKVAANFFLALADDRSEPITVQLGLQLLVIFLVIFRLPISQHNLIFILLI